MWHWGTRVCKYAEAQFDSGKWLEEDERLQDFPPLPFSQFKMPIGESFLVLCALTAVHGASQRGIYAASGCFQPESMVRESLKPFLPHVKFQHCWEMFVPLCPPFCKRTHLSNHNSTHVLSTMQIGPRIIITTLLKLCLQLVLFCWCIHG